LWQYASCIVDHFSTQESLADDDKKDKDICSAPDLNSGHNSMMTPSRGISDADLCFGALFACKLLYFCMASSSHWRNHDWFAICNISPFQICW